MTLRLLPIVAASALLTASIPARAQAPSAPPPPPPLAPRATPSAAGASDPLEPKWNLKSPPAVIGGGALIIAGTAASATGMVLYVAAVSIKCDDSPCPHPTTGPLVLLGNGIAALAAGIPLVVWGAQAPPARAAPVPAWAGAPGGAGWQWKF